MISLRLSAAFLAFALVAGAFPGFAQQAEQTAKDDDVVVITGKQTEEAIRDFVGQVAIATQGENQLARWDRKICPGLVGLPASYAQLAIDQIARRAFDVGLDVGDPGCSANIVIIVSMDPDAVAQELFDKHRRGLGYYYESGRKTLGRDALKAFVDSKEPVRWWHVSNTVTADGRKVGGASDKPGKVPSVSIGAVSRIKRTTRQDFSLALVIVDGRRMDNVNLLALADYIAMASLAQLDADADTSAYPSILNMFKPRTEGSPAPASMTEWDIAYLHGLYDATRESNTAKKQQGEIARSMNKDLSSPH